MTQRPWQDCTFVAFDTETSGQYPLTAEICEVAAVKWHRGEIVGTFQSLIKPSRLMDANVIQIHGITNEMVANAPVMKEKIAEFHHFMQDAIPIAHHAPFDLGFLAIEFEAVGLPLPTLPAICSSLLSRKIMPESLNHRLQTLIQYLGIEKGTAHRALDDAKACLQVGLRCMERMGEGTTLQQVLDAQGGALTWQRFSMAEFEKSQPYAPELIKATRANKDIEMVYSGGSTPGEARRLHPMGVVRSLDGDFLIAYCEKDQRSKRFFLDKITSVKIV